MKKTSRAALEAAEIDLFRQAVADAKPLPKHGKMVRRKEPPPPYPVHSHLDEHAALAESMSAQLQAEDWMDAGDEPSFLRPGLSREVLRKLRRGGWVTRDQLDLHGMNRHEARDALAAFLAGCLRRGVRCVRVIHGKGLGSKNREPVLKEKVKLWLTRRDEVLAYCQARPTDGGSGATLVLLKSQGAV
jgi:DNA-nicking Smr family endonuclease